MRKNRKISWILTVAFIFSIIFSLPAVPVVAGCQDISGHWAESQIEYLMAQKIISGYPDNTFKPENPISRAEFIVITNKAFNFSASTTFNYSDVKPTDWFAADIARAKAAGYISGYEDGTMKPNQQISRQEAASIVARILALTPADTTATLQGFSDNNTIANWSRDSIAAMVENGYLKGYPDNSFKPTNSIKRAEATVIFKIVLDSERDGFKVEPKPEPEKVQSLFDKAGTYGPKTGTQTINENVTISASGVILQNLIIEKNLIIAKEVGDGDVTLNNVTVKGKTYVHGGGKDSIHINGGQYSEIIIEKTATGQVRIVAVNTSGLKVSISENAKGEEIILNGDIKTVTIKADDVKITAQGKANIGEIKVESGLKDVNIELAKDSTLKEIVLNSKTDVKGEGAIEKASGSKVNESSFAKKPASITTSSTTSSSRRSSDSSKTQSTTKGTLSNNVSNTATQFEEINFEIYYVLGEDYNNGTVIFTLPDQYFAGDEDQIQIANGEVTNLTEEQTPMPDSGEPHTVVIKSITAKAGQTITLFMNYEYLWAHGIFTVTAKGDADGPGAKTFSEESITTFTIVKASKYSIAIKVFNQSGEEIIDVNIELKDSEKQVITAEQDGTYKLEASTYSYTVSAEGYETSLGDFTVREEPSQITIYLSPVQGVSAITVTGTGDATTIETNGGTLQMIATVSPDNANNKAVTWTVTETDGAATDKATISNTGLLTAVKNGTVKVTATVSTPAVNGTQDITISGQVDTEITGYDAIADIDGGKEGSATYATVELAKAALPETVTITGTADTVPVTWSADSEPTYAITEGTYVFTGTIGDLPAGYVDAVDTIATVTAKVVIGAADPITVDALSLDALVTAPVKDATPDITAIDETQYTGTIEWFESDGTTEVTGNFAASTVYVAKVTLTAKEGFTLTGVVANSFTYTGAIAANAADSGAVTITFAATAE